MTEKDLHELLSQVQSGALSIADGLSALKTGPFRQSELGFAALDHHRSLRHRLGEVVYGEGKSAEQIVQIVRELAQSGRPVLTTRVSAEKMDVLEKAFEGRGRVNRVARTFTMNAPARKDAASDEPFVGVLAAGTSDLDVAEEALEVCVAMGVAAELVVDIGVTGLQRLLGRLELIQKASALVVVAGMEGALPSVVSGLTGRPVFAVPTAVGYGASFGGVTALLAMLNSCAPGVTVVNIGNGFSAAFAAGSVVCAIREAQDARGSQA